MAKRKLTLTRRQATITNLNFQPEKHGDELVERADLSLEILLSETDIGQVLSTRGNPLKALWDKDGELVLRELDGAFKLQLKVEGDLRLAFLGADDDTPDGAVTFEAAVLDKCAFEPMFNRQATLRCKVRVDPRGHLEMLGEMRCAEQIMLEFDGAGEASQSQNQGQMPV